MNWNLSQKLAQILLAATMLWSLTGCGAYLLSEMLDDDDDSNYKVTAKNRNNDNNAKADCALEDPNDLPANALVQSNSLQMETVSQLHIYQDCDGKQTSTGMLKVSDDDTRIDLVSKNNSEPIQEYSIYNRSTCRSFSPALFSWKKHGAEGNLVHMILGLNSNLDNNLKVRDGLNVISYRFYAECLNGTTTCKKTERRVLEEGLLRLDVNHEVKNLPDPKIVKAGPNNTTCP